MRISDWSSDVCSSDLIVDTFDMSTFMSSTANADGKSRRKGIEASVEATPADWLRVSASYTYLDTGERKVAGAALVRETRRARHSASLSADASLARLSMRSEEHTSELQSLMRR